MFIIQSHLDILNNPMYETCADATEFRFPVSTNHLEHLSKLFFLATVEDGVALHVQKLTAVDDVIYVYIDKVSSQILNELRMVLRPHIQGPTGKIIAVCKPEGRDITLPARCFGFTIPKALQNMAALTAILGEVQAKVQMGLIATLIDDTRELEMQIAPDEDFADYLTDNGLKHVSVWYVL